MIQINHKQTEKSKMADPKDDDDLTELIYDVDLDDDDFEETTDQSNEEEQTE